MSFTIKKLFPRKLARKMMGGLSFLPDSLYLKLFYFAATGKTLNLRTPKLFSEKEQWLKLHDIHPEYKDLVDKMTVNKYIDEILGEGYCFPTIGYWERFDDIDFDDLPDSFVLKCNHDSGSTKVVTDKNSLTKKDIDDLKKFFNARVKKDFYHAGREYPYKGIKPFIMAQKYMANNGKINDYKFFCFNGEPKIMFVATDRSVDVKFDFFDMDFNHLDIVNIHPNSGKRINKPECFDEMKQIAAKLSKGMKFVRIDLYEINGKVYFGEFTFFHGGGFCLFFPIEWEKKLGDLIDLNSPKIVME